MTPKHSIACRSWERGGGEYSLKYSAGHLILLFDLDTRVLDLLNKIAHQVFRMA